MSATYIRRLRLIRDEFDAAQRALAYIMDHWHNQEIISHVDTFPRKSFDRAAQNLEITYFIRLFAELEGILKDHLATNHSHISVPASPRVQWLISRVLRAEALTIDPALQIQLEAVQAYRNSIAHRGAAAIVTFRDALARLNRFLDKLPDPLK